MTNKEIRQKALTKVKVKRLTVIVVSVYAISWTRRFFGDLTGEFWLDAAISSAAAFLYSFVTGAGLARVTMGAWRRGEARFGELFAYFRDPKLFRRGAALGGIMALINLANLAAGLIPGYGGSAVGLLLGVLGLLMYFPYFAIELYPEKRPGDALKRGLSGTFSNAGRILLMELAIGWWIALVLIVAVTIAAFAAGLSGLALDLVASVVALALCWTIGAYVGLVNAGLAREIFRD